MVLDVEKRRHLAAVVAQKKSASGPTAPAPLLLAPLLQALLPRLFCSSP